MFHRKPPPKGLHGRLHVKLRFKQSGRLIVDFDAHAGGNDASDQLHFLADPLVERLANGDPAKATHNLADWADPLDAAILAACLLQRPFAELDRRAASAALSHRMSEASFWRAAGVQLAAITAPTNATLEAPAYATLQPAKPSRR